MRKCLALQKGSLLFETCDLGKQVRFFHFKIRQKDNMSIFLLKGR